MKKIILAVVLFFTLSVAPAFADYTIDLKNESGTVLKTYIVTATQVQHLQKVATRTGKSVINQIKEAILDIIALAKTSNGAKWIEDNPDYIDEQSRQ